jgi:hypothetical protein
MSTQIRRIEKEYFLSRLAAEQIPVIYIFNRQDYVLKVDRITKEEIEFTTEKPVEGLVANKKINLMFNYKGLNISFPAEVKYISDTVISTLIPDALYKNLARSSQRVDVPSDIEITLMSLEDRYSLPFPKSSVFEPLDSSVVPPDIDPMNLNAILALIGQELKPYASGYKIIYYNTTTQPDKMEERLVAENGRILFIPSTQMKFPQEFIMEKNYITQEIFRRYLESIGVGITFLDQTIDQFIQSKKDEGIASFLWIPFIFQEYVVGCIYIWQSALGAANKRSFSEEFAEKLYKYGKCVIFSLKQRDYFEAGRMKDRIINGKVADISGSGLRFAVPNSYIYQTLQPGSEIAITMKTSERVIHSKAKIRRRYKEGALVYLGCSFIEMTPDDSQFLFEYIYGKPSHPTAKQFVFNNV